MHWFPQIFILLCLQDQGDGWMTQQLWKGKKKKNIVFCIRSYWESGKILTSMSPSLLLQPPNHCASPRTNSPPQHCSEISSQGGGGVCDSEKMMWVCREDALFNQFALSSICMLRAFSLDCFFFFHTLRKITQTLSTESLKEEKEIAIARIIWLWEGKRQGLVGLFKIRRKAGELRESKKFRAPKQVRHP